MGSPAGGTSDQRQGAPQSALNSLWAMGWGHSQEAQLSRTTWAWSLGRQHPHPWGGSGTRMRTGGLGLERGQAQGPCCVQSLAHLGHWEVGVCRVPEALMASLLLLPHRGRNKALHWGSVPPTAA